MSGSDDDLLARLRATDPASSLPLADPTRVARLLEETMSHDVLSESRESGTHGRSPLTWLVAAAAAVIIGGVGIYAVANHDSATDPAPAAQDEPTLTELSAPGEAAYAAKCMVPNAEVLAGTAVAFDGTVQGIEDDLVTLEPTHWYAGGPTDLVTVEAPSDNLRLLLTAVEFKDGGRYLVAATDNGEVMVCGFSAPYTDPLAAIYAEAFGG